MREGGEERTQIFDTFEDHLGLSQAARDLMKMADPATPPRLVVPIPRLKGDVMCLLEFFQDKEPSIRCV